MKRISVYLGLACLMAGCLASCSSEELASSAETASVQSDLIDIAQTSGQLASGTSFRISGSSSYSLATRSDHRPGGGKHKRGPAILDGVNLLAPTDELLAIIDAESASDFRGLLISRNGGATVNNYDANGNVVTLNIPKAGGPGGCSFSGNQYPEYDSLLAVIAKTVIDFGSGSIYKHDTISIVRTGKIIITRVGTKANMTETTTFENYTVNGIGISGTKTRVNTYDDTTGSGSSKTSISDGKITMKDGAVASWITNKSRISQIILGSNGRPESGEITTDVSTLVTAANGTLIYMHLSTKPLIESIACDRRRHGPVSGTLKTIYGSDVVEVDYGDGTCENKTITLTVNGTTTIKTIGE